MIPAPGRDGAHRSALFAPCGAYMDASRFGKRSLHLAIKDLAAVLYPACCAGRKNLLALMESADETLI